MTLTLAEAITAAEEQLGRKLDSDEIAIVGRLVDAEEGMDEILEILGEHVHIPTDEELETIRYEAAGDGVNQIPNVVEEDV